MRRVGRRGDNGDTLIEVIFAFVIFALVTVGSLTIMNQGISAAQRSLEITLVRAQMDAQAEAIRYIHQAYVASYQPDGSPPTGTAAEWVKMTDMAAKGADFASEFGRADGPVCPATTPGQKPFILNARTARVWDSSPASSVAAGSTLPPFSQVIYNNDFTIDPVTGVPSGPSINQAYGIWIESIPSDTKDGTGFVDFHIRSCWSGAGSSTPVTLGTIVRLYEPRN